MTGVQTCGAKLAGKYAGTFGDVGVFSFGLGKNLMATGGGMLVTNSDEVFENVSEIGLLREKESEILKRTIRILLEFRLRKYLLKYSKIVSSLVRKAKKNMSEILSFSSRRMSNLDASLGLIQLKKLNTIVQRSVKNSSLLTELLSEIDEIETPRGEYPNHIFTQYTICTPNANQYCSWVDSLTGTMHERNKILVEMKKYLDRRKIETMWSYTPLHSMYNFKRYVRTELRKTEYLSRRVIHLPVHPSISEEHTEYVASNVKDFFRKLS